MRSLEEEEELVLEELFCPPVDPSQVVKLEEAKRERPDSPYGVLFAEEEREAYTWCVSGNYWNERYDLSLTLTGTDHLIIADCTWTMNSIPPWLPEALVRLAYRLPQELPLLAPPGEPKFTTSRSLASLRQDPLLAENATPWEKLFYSACCPHPLTAPSLPEAAKPSVDTLMERLRSALPSGPLTSGEAQTLMLTGELLHLLKLPPFLQDYSWQEESAFMLAYLLGSEGERACLEALAAFCERLSLTEEDFSFFTSVLEIRQGRFLLSEVPLRVFPWREGSCQDPSWWEKLALLSPQEGILLLRRICGRKYDESHPGLTVGDSLQEALSTLSQAQEEGEELLRQWLSPWEAEAEGYVFCLLEPAAPFYCRWLRELLPHRGEFTPRERLLLLQHANLLRQEEATSPTAPPLLSYYRRFHPCRAGYEWHGLPLLLQAFGTVPLARLHLQGWGEEDPLSPAEVEALTHLPREALASPPSWWLPLVREKKDEVPGVD